MARISKVLFLVMVFPLLFGCANQFGSVSYVNLTSTFVPKDAEHVLGDGANSISGSALIRRNDGMVVTCAGIGVSLVPATTYANERMAAIYQSNTSAYKPVFGSKQIVFSPDSFEYSHMIREAFCDARGEFSFKNVTDGTYYVTTQVTWKSSPYVVEGGYLMKKIRVYGGQSVNIVLTP